MNIVEIHGATLDQTWGTHFVDITLDEGEGQVRLEYPLAADDQEGFAPAIRAGLEAWAAISGNTILPHVADIEERRQFLLGRVAERHAAALQLLSGAYTLAERETFATQLRWAERYIALDLTTANMLEKLMTQVERDAAIAANQLPAEVMAGKIIAKDANYQLLVAEANGLKRTSEEKINAAVSSAELDAVVIELETLETQTMAAYAAATGAQIIV